VGNLVYGSARREYVSERIEDLRQKIAENDMGKQKRYVSAVYELIHLSSTDNVCELLPDPIRDDLKVIFGIYYLIFL
jgi:hypothetical protein